MGDDTARDPGAPDFDADVIVIGSGFGGSVAALRFAEAGEKVLVLERGTWVTRQGFEPDLDALWLPRRNAFGFHDIRARGATLIPWLGAAVGGGSHVYAGTLLRRESFDDLPGGISAAEMEPHYARAEELLDARPYPDYPPYDQVRATQLGLRTGARLREQYPQLVQAAGPNPLGVAFAPPGGGAGKPFVNKHGAPQRYQDPREQALLGGDIECKNTLDKNYLFLAQQLGARIAPLHEADRIAPLPGGGYEVACRVYRPERRSLPGLLRRWLPGLFPPNHGEARYRARRLVVAAGAIGSAELLLRNRDLHRTLPRLGAWLGERYNTNGDFITLIIPFRAMVPAWLGFAGAVAAALALQPLWILPCLALYYGALARQRPFDPDLGTTNSEYVRFVGPAGEDQGVYVEGGRYPNPGKSLVALVLSAFHAWRPRRYLAISRAAAVLRALVPPLGAIARTWPIPLLTMGKDAAHGTISLDGEGRATIRYDVRANQAYYAYVTDLGHKVARAAGAWFLPNLGWLLFRRLEVPHNQGGVPMGPTAATGVVDDCGRVFGHDDLVVLDGSILPVSPRPNPALTILAICERAMEKIVAQLRALGTIAAVETRPPAPPSAIGPAEGSGPTSAEQG